MPDPIEHVVVLMLENHSFDEMLGGMTAECPRHRRRRSVRPAQQRRRSGPGLFPGPEQRPAVSPDPKHETIDVLAQLANNNGGFVLDYCTNPPTTPAQRQQIMSYYPPGALSALHELARHFAVCDRWFSSVPGPTWTNRFFVHSGTSLGRVKMPGGLVGNPALYLGYDQDTVYDRLNARGIDWRVYFGDIPHSLVMSHQRRPENLLRHRPLAEFYADAADANNPFPPYSFLEPHYYWPNQNDDHPPHPTARAEQLIANVYNALRTNQSAVADDPARGAVRRARRLLRPRLAAGRGPARRPQPRNTPSTALAPASPPCSFRRGSMRASCLPCSITPACCATCPTSGISIR